MSKEQTSIAANIRRYRTEKKLSQEKLARLADLAFPTISKIESGETPNPTIETMRKIAAALSINLYYFLK